MKILKKNKPILDIFMNMEKMVSEPIKAPNSNLIKVDCLLKTRAVANKSNKSKKKFNIITKSKYIFIVSPFIL